MIRSKKKLNKARKGGLSEHSFDYYQRIGSIIHDESAENLGDVLDNMFEELKEETVPVCQCPQTSPIIENVVPLASCANIKSLLEVFSQDWIKVCTNSCSSYVVQKAMLVIPNFITQKLKDFDFDHPDDTDETYLINTVLELATVCKEDLEKSLTDPHMSHIVRALIQVLGGVFVDESANVQKNKRSKGQKHKFQDENEKPRREVRFDKFDSPAKYKESLKEIFVGMFELEKMGVLLTDRNVNPLIGTLLKVLHKSDKELCKKAIHKIIKLSRIQDAEDTDNLPPVVTDTIGSFLMQEIAALCDDIQYKELHKKMFKRKIHKFAAHPKASFVLQSFIKSCKVAEIFDKVLDELSENIESFWKTRNYGVLTAITESALQHTATEQDKVLQMLMRMLKCWEPEERRIKFPVLLVTMKTYDGFFKDSTEVTDIPDGAINYHGSLLLQHLLKFSKTALITDGILDLTPASFMKVICSSVGSHIIDSFFLSETVKAKAKGNLVDKMTGHYVEIACHAQGSWTLENMWRILDLKHKTTIATELSAKKDMLQYDQYGKHVYRNLSLQQFINRQAEWKTAQKNYQKMRQILGVVSETDGKPPAGKKMKMDKTRKSEKERNKQKL